MESVDWNWKVWNICRWERSRSLHGERGLKYVVWCRKEWLSCRSLHGERGLKSSEWHQSNGILPSLSTWRAWIEISLFPALQNKEPVALYMESVDWNNGAALLNITEIGRSLHGERGLKYKKKHRCTYKLPSLSTWRAWIEISHTLNTLGIDMSLSTWRAWIEIQLKYNIKISNFSRSLHGERGLKSFGYQPLFHHEWSLSTWRAWIEMSQAIPYKALAFVALYMESVDWN